MKRIRPGTVLLVVLILVLGYSLAIRQRREARLRAALGLYKGRMQRHIEDILDRPNSVDWPDGTPLSDVVERIKHATGRPGWTSFAATIVIYVDPQGLREAGRSLDSPVPAPPPDDADSPRVSLRQAIRIALEPLGLACEEKGGAIVITSRRRVEQSPEPAVAGDGERRP